jgi:hypothetical protein
MIPIVFDVLLLYNHIFSVPFILTMMLLSCPHRSQTLLFFCLWLHLRHTCSVSSLLGLGDGVISKLLYSLSLYVACVGASPFTVDSLVVLPFICIELEVVGSFGKYGRKYPILGDPGNRYEGAYPG